MDEDVLATLKILINGDSVVGKPNLLLRFTDDTFDLELAATIGVDFKVKTISVDGNKTKLAIWEKREVDKNAAFMLFIEASAKTCDGVPCAFEELVDKIIQTPGLWESENQNKGVKRSHSEEGQGGGAFGAYCSVLYTLRSSSSCTFDQIMTSFLFINSLTALLGTLLFAHNLWKFHSLAFPGRLSVDLESTQIIWFGEHFEFLFYHMSGKFWYLY
ncbi:ras-related protein Rab-18-like [Echinops telfairi]|uniref:Ras-related protein Rab-18-like n=1 Tax=Echinops telfairi TaxID=9371 RepID=A0ABM0IU36_ECHTE|nr:ras-related protein Rab-18-like [Echinops telfairi]